MPERWEQIDEARQAFEGRVSVIQAAELIAIARSQAGRIRQLEALTQTQAHYHATLRQRHDADRRKIERVEGERDILERAPVRIRDLQAVGVEQHAAATALTAALEGGPDA